MTDRLSDSRKFWTLLSGLDSYYHQAVMESLPEIQRKRIMQFSVKQAHLIKVVHIMTANNPAGVSLKDLADRLHVTAASASELVETLVRRGYLQRKTCEEDRRSVRISCSAQGVRMRHVHEEQLDRMAHEDLNVLSADEQTQLLELLDRVFKRVKRTLD